MNDLIKLDFMLIENRVQRFLYLILFGYGK